MNKKIQDIALWFLLGAGVLFFLYQKGYILAPFPSVDAAQARAMLGEGNVTLLDVRTPQEYADDGHIAGATLVPVGELQNRLSQLEGAKATRILVYCRSGSRSVSAARLLSAEGFSVTNLSGGIGAWKGAGYPVE